MKPKRFYRREWLNKRRYQTSGHIILDVRCEVDKYGKPLKAHRSVNTSFELMDCNRKISLDFYMNEGKDSKGSNANVLAKAYRLQENLNDFVEALEIAKEWVEGDA